MSKRRKGKGGQRPTQRIRLCSAFREAFCPQNVFRLFRDRVDTWTGLLRELREDPDDPPYALERVVKELIDADLLVTATDGFKNGKVSVSSRWPKIQEVLGVSLTELEDVRVLGAMIMKPFHGRPRPMPDIDVFVLMPFAESMKPVYIDHIRRVVERQRMLVKRADDFFTAQNLMGEIWSAMNAARVVIADCTGRKANVFYEIGLAHALGKPVILITQNESDVPFDLRYIRYIKYDLTPRGMREFEDVLSKTLAPFSPTSRGVNSQFILPEVPAVTRATPPAGWPGPERSGGAGCAKRTRSPFRDATI